MSYKNKDTGDVIYSIQKRFATPITQIHLHKKEKPQFYLNEKKMGNKEKFSIFATHNRNDSCLIHFLSYFVFGKSQSSMINHNIKQM